MDLDIDPGGLQVLDLSVGATVEKCSEIGSLVRDYARASRSMIHSCCFV